jgi:hypothetical protein
VNCAVLLVSSALTVLAQKVMPCLASQLQKAKTVTGHDVAACLQVGTAANFGLIGPSEFIASQIFERIGVRLRWSCEQLTFVPGRSKSPILIQPAGDTPSDLHKGALGYARPYAKTGVRIVVFYDRVEAVVVNRPVSGSAILGYVFAHEIGHVLSGIAVHADRGLMRARWTSGDFHSMAARSLSFAPEDAELIRNNVK